MKCRITSEFFRQALAQEKQIRAALRKVIVQLEQLSFLELTRHKGIHWEKLSGLDDPETGNPLYFIRITLPARAIAVVDKDTLVLLTIHSEHDKAYRRN